MSLIEMERIVEGVCLGKKIRSVVGYIRYVSGDVKEVVGYINMEFGGEF